MSDRDDAARQRRFYGTREHAHLRVREDDRYAGKLASRLAEGLGIGPEHRVLELGAGFGRFTFHLLPHCRSIVALDVSQRTLDSLVRTRDERGIPAERCRPWRADLTALGDPPPGQPFDFAVGFFLLHHLPDFAATIRALAPFLRPGGGMGFVEPNRRNPLYLAQVACCPDMSWAEEKGMFALSAKAVEAAFRAAGLESARSRRFGFFPPQIVNRLAAARALEARLERMRALEWLLPFLLLRARAPAH